MDKPCLSMPIASSLKTSPVFMLKPRNTSGSPGILRKTEAFCNNLPFYANHTSKPSPFVNISDFGANSFCILRGEVFNAFLGGLFV